MKREFRILKHEEFRGIISESPFEKSSCFVVHFRKNKDEKLRIGINVGKRNGGAVTRNKIKRQIRSLVSLHFDFTKPFDLIILVRPTYSPSLYRKAEEELKGLWTKIGEKNFEKENEH